MNANSVINADCLDVMGEIKPHTIDAIITDLPFETTQNDWDKQLNFGTLWRCVNEVLKPNGVFVTFGSGLFISELVVSNPKMWKYNLIWEKSTVTGFLNANRMPLRSHEDILVFYHKQPTYNPQKEHGSKNHTRGKDKPTTGNNYGRYGFQSVGPCNDGMKFPRSVLHFDTVPPSKKTHPTEKPVPLMQYLVKTYTNPLDTVLDMCCGTGACLVACKQTGRNFIGIDISQKYCDVARDRVARCIIGDKE
jgi:site-specific DNA-methyltransferase (adenine-specific)